MTTVSQHSFDLASEKGNVAPAPTLCRLATELCMYVIAHTFCVVHSRMLLSMFPLLFTAQALRLALYDLASNGDFVVFAIYDLASDGDFVVCPCLFLSFFDLVSKSANSAFLLHGTATTVGGVTVVRRGDYVLSSLRQRLHSGKYSKKKQENAWFAHPS